MTNRYSEVEEQVICANCGRKSGGYYENLVLPKGEAYKGNSRVVSRKDGTYDGTTAWRLNRGTYKSLGYGNFCTLRCAEEFANAAVAIGFHRRAER